MDIVNYALSNKIKKYVDESVGNIPDEKITEAVNTYLNENPVTPGATDEQATQIQKNTDDITGLKGDLSYISEVAKPLVVKKKCIACICQLYYFGR